jgi:hypothetical protein
MTTTSNKRKLIAFTGYAGAGKDEAAAPLIAAGWQRRAFGDVIKGIFDALVQEHLGFSAFTADRALKSRIRGLLVHGGEAFYDTVFDTYFHALFTDDRLPPLVNTRLMRLREAVKWKECGGIIIEVVRPGVHAAEPCEAAWLAEISAAGHIDHRILNGGTVQALHQAVCAIAGIPMTPTYKSAPLPALEVDVLRGHITKEYAEELTELRRRCGVPAGNPLLALAA